MRDKCDLRMLLAHDEFLKEAYGEGEKKGKIGPPVSKNWAEGWRRKLKIAPAGDEMQVRAICALGLTFFISRSAPV